MIRRILTLFAVFFGLLVGGCPEPCRAQSVPNDLVELARSLKGDPDLIYEYVYNNIQTIPMYASLKGALGAMLDGQGTCFDQAELMVTLLQLSGYTAEFVVGQIHLSPTQAATWLGTDTTLYSLYYVFGYSGFIYNIAGSGGIVSDVQFSWAWVKVNIDGTDYVFDPATKSLNRSAGMTTAALAAAMGYTQSTFLSDAAAVTTTAPWALTSLNRTAVRNDLTTYARNLVQNIRSTNAAASPSDIIGGVKITPLPLGTQQRIPASTGLPNQYGTTVNYYSALPSMFRVTLSQQFGWYSGSGFNSLSSAIVFNTADIYGLRMTVQFSSSSVPSLVLDGVTQMTASGAVPAGYQLTVRVSISFPSSWGGYPNVTNSDATQLPAAPNSVQAITSSWGPVGRGMIERHRRLLQQNMAANPGNPNAEAVLGESLSIVGYTYAAEYTQHAVLIGQLGSTVPLLYFFYGTTGLGTHGGVTGPFISIWIRAQRYMQANNRAVGDGVKPIEGNAFFAEGLVASLTESATLEQTQPGTVAVSTTKLTDIAVQQGARIFDINNNTISGDTASYYASTIRPIMASTWNGNDLAAIDANVANGERIIASQNGAISVNLYTGIGWFRDVQLSGFDNIGGSISGNLHGGAPASNVTPEQANTGTSESVTPAPTSTPAITIIGSIYGRAGAILGLMQSSLEPINLVTGDYYHSTTDLSIGSQGPPFGLSFQRYYDSGTRLQNGTMGFGWTHNFAVNAATDSDPFEGLAANSPINGAAAIAATFVVLDIANTGVSGGRPLDRFVISSVIYRWLSDLLTANIVAVTRPGYVEHFVRLADGSFNPPSGSAAILSASGGGFTYVAGDRTALTFDASGNLTSQMSPAGAAITLTYAGTPEVLSSVTNNLGRSLNFTYTSGMLTRVTDDSGRNVSFAYDVNGNLSTFVDVLGQTTSYSYDIPGRMTQLYYPWTSGQPFITNTYDSLDRVQRQVDLLGQTWWYYLAGTRAEEINPAQVKHVYYFTPHGKTSIDIQNCCVSSSQIVSTNSWDALDRLTVATAPEGNTTGYTYDINSNALTVTKTPKPGSLLSPLVTTTAYDPVYNKPLTVTDPLGHVTAMAYDPATGNLMSMIADSGALKAMTRYTYNGLGLPLTVADPTGTVTRNAYDGSGNVTSVIRDAGTGRLNLTTSFTYNSAGDALTVTDARGAGFTTTNTYDVARQLVTTTTPASAGAPSGLLTINTYDTAGRVTQVQQASGGSVLRTTSKTYTLSGKVATSTDFNGHVTRYAYDFLDRRTSMTDATGRVTQYGYDVLDRLTQVSNPAISTSPLMQQAYTLNGFRASLTDAGGNMTGFAYDGFDRLATTTYPATGTPPTSTTESLTYDADSNILTRTTRAGATIAYTYDTLNRLSTKTPPSPAPVVTYTYDLAGRMTGVTDTSPAFAATPSGTLTYATNTTYDSLNRPTGITFGDVPAASAPGTGVNVAFTHTYNAVNQRTGQTVSDSAWIDYPPATASTTAYTANALNQYTAVGAVTPGYDANGNTTADGTNTLAYDAENRLVSASRAGMTATYTFDGRGRRKSKTVNGTTTVFVTDADNREVLEYDGSSGTILRWYAYGLGSNDVLAQMDVAGGTRLTPVPDLQGSVIATMSNAGTLTSFAYGAYGGSTSAPAQFGYTGQRVDAEIGSYYYRARQYFPGWGRFPQTDPIEHAGGIHLYAYVGNDPLNLLDPFGLNAERSDGSSVDQSSPANAADPTTNAQVSDGQAGTEVLIGYSSPGSFLGSAYYHSYIKVIGADGQTYFIRAGPGAAGTGLLALTTEQSGLMSISGSGYGNLTVTFGARAQAIEMMTPTVVMISAGTVSQPFSQVVNSLANFGAAVNAANIPYGPTTTNSNAFAAQGVTVLGLARPTAPVWAPGTNTLLRVR